MKIPGSLRQLTIEIEAVSRGGCAWILFDLALPTQQKLWQPGARELVRTSDPDRVAAAAKCIPTGGQGATSRADWARKLVAALAVAGESQSETFVLPIVEKAVVKACVGWCWPGQAGATTQLLPHLPSIRAQFRKACALEKARTEAEALQWLLARSDRLCAVARPDGELLGASLSGRDFLQQLNFGRRHFFRAEDAVLPSVLARSIGKSGSGQVVLNGACTARFERLALTGSAWMPVVGIEFFPESNIQPGLPLSKLTAVERDILGQIASGKTNREIAQHRGTAFATVKNQVSSLLDKLGVSRRIELLSPPSGIQFLQANSAVDGGSTAVTR